MDVKYRMSNVQCNQILFMLSQNVRHKHSKTCVKERETHGFVSFLETSDIQYKESQIREPYFELRTLL